MVYRITGVKLRWSDELRRYVAVERETVHRARNGDLAYYEDLSHAKRGLIGFKGNGAGYIDYRIEGADAEWHEVV